MSFGCGAESPTVPILLTDLSAESRLTHYDHKSNAVEIQSMSGRKVRRSNGFYIQYWGARARHLLCDGVRSCRSNDSFSHVWPMRHKRGREHDEHAERRICVHRPALKEFNWHQVCSNLAEMHCCPELSR